MTHGEQSTVDSTSSQASPELHCTVNGAPVSVQVPPDTPLLWMLRQTLALPGTRYGCGAALCGACTVLVDGVPTRACATPASSLDGHTVTTIEGVQGPVAEAVQEAWAAVGVSQCGYCQSGQVMSAIALLTRTSSPSDDELTRAMDGNLCRCGTYPRIRAAIHHAAGLLRARREGNTPARD